MAMIVELDLDTEAELGRVDDWELGDDSPGVAGSLAGVAELLVAVVMYGCVFGSTSGFTRNEIGAILPARHATALSASSSAADSTLKQRMPADNAASISGAVLPTPENTVLAGSPPAAMTLANSPPDTISKPLPRRARMFSTARLELALTA